MRFRTQMLAAMVVFALFVAACADDDSANSTTPGSDESSDTTTSAAPDDTEADPTTTVDGSDEAGPATSDDTEWVTNEAGEGCVCSDGSDYIYFSRTNDPEKVLLYYQGGGACFSETMCDINSGSYDPTVDPDEYPSEPGSGIFELDNPANPFADWSIIFMPYCSGDVFLGDATHDYDDNGDGEVVTIEHRGYRNALKGVEHVVENFPDVTHLFVAGSSAGSVPTPFMAGLASDLLPDTDIAVLADASGGYASNPLVNGVIGGIWGATKNIPDWPETEGIEPEEFGIPDLFAIAGSHDPDIRMARYDNTADAVQTSFAALAGLESGVQGVLDQNEALVEEAGVNLPVYIAPGPMHTILGTPLVYSLEVDGVMFIDWLTDHVNGEDPGDVRCPTCVS